MQYEQEILTRVRARLREAQMWYIGEQPLAAPTTGGTTWKRSDRLFFPEAVAADNPADAVRTITNRRSALIATEYPSLEMPSQEGRLLLLLTDKNLMDGAAYLASGYFIGELNVPPCDLWVEFLPAVELATESTEPVLLSWIPWEFIDRVQRGVSVNPEECLLWADDDAPELAKLLER